MSAAQRGGWLELYHSLADLIGSGPEARWLLEEVSGLSWTEMITARSGPAALVCERAKSLAQRRASGEPLQYVLGSWPFRSLSLMVDQRVLIPRPETEQVVEVALVELDRLSAATPGRLLTGVDLGTGSGAIALSMVAERTGVEVWATDVAEAALAVARANLAGLGGYSATRVKLCHGDWWSALPHELQGKVDLLVSNPPYLANAELAGLPSEVRDWEPMSALVAGDEGTEAIETVLGEAPRWLGRPAAAVVEIAPSQATKASKLATGAGFDQVDVRSDLAGRPRVLVARREALG